MKQPTKARLKEIIITLDQMRKYRCLYFGCIYGIPGIDTKPKDKCIFCGEPMPDRTDYWGESEALAEFNQYHKHDSAIINDYLNKLWDKKQLINDKKTTKTAG